MKMEHDINNRGGVQSALISVSSNAASESDAVFKLVMADIQTLLLDRRKLVQRLCQLEGQPDAAEGVYSRPCLNFKYGGYDPDSGCSVAERATLASLRQQHQRAFDRGAASILTHTQPPPPARQSARNGYELSADMRNVTQQRVLQMVGLQSVDLNLAHSAAVTIQRAFRLHQMKRHFQRTYQSNNQQQQQQHRSSQHSSEESRPRTPVKTYSTLPPTPPPKRSSTTRLSHMQPGLSAAGNSSGVVHAYKYDPPIRSHLGGVAVNTSIASGGGSTTCNDLDQDQFPPPPLHWRNADSPVSPSVQAHIYGTAGGKSDQPSPVGSTSSRGSCNGFATNYINIDKVISQGQQMSNRTSTCSEHASSGSDDAVDTQSIISSDRSRKSSQGSGAGDISSGMSDSSYQENSSTLRHHRFSVPSPGPTSLVQSAAAVPVLANHRSSAGTPPPPSSSPITYSRPWSAAAPPRAGSYEEGAANSTRSPRETDGYSDNSSAASSSRAPNRRACLVRDNLVQLHSCRRTGVKNTPKQELTVRVGLFIFNSDPWKGVRFFMEHGYLRHNSPEDVAFMFACNRRGLSKFQVGEYLGSEKPFNLAVLQNFADLNRIRFENRPIDEALRSFLSLFRLPGESQKIDRILEHFGRVYASSNEQTALILCGDNCSSSSVLSRLKKGASAAHILSYAIMMLNTDQHSSKVQSSMSMKEFKKNCHGSNELRHLDDAFLEGIYKRVREQKFAVPDDSSTTVAKFAKNLSNYPRILEEPYRCLVAACPFHYVEDPLKSDKLIELTLFLFNDILLVAAKEPQKKKLSKALKGLDSLLAQTFQYKFDIPLLNVKVEPFMSQPQNRNDRVMYGMHIHARGVGVKRKVHTFLSFDRGDLENFLNDLRTTARDMEILEQLRIQENSSLMKLGTRQPMSDEQNNTLTSRHSAGSLANTKCRSGSIDSLFDTGPSDSYGQAEEGRRSAMSFAPEASGFGKSKPKISKSKDIRSLFKRPPSAALNPLRTPILRRGYSFQVSGGSKRDRLPSSNDSDSCIYRPNSGYEPYNGGAGSEGSYAYPSYGCTGGGGGGGGGGLTMKSASADLLDCPIYGLDQDSPSNDAVFNCAYNAAVAPLEKDDAAENGKPAAAVKSDSLINQAISSNELYQNHEKVSVFL